MAGGFLPSFIFGGDTGSTPESLKLQRQMALQAMLAGDSPKNVGEGFNSIGRSIAAALMDRQAAEQEKAGQAGALDAMRGSETLGPLLGGGGGATGLSSMPAPTGDAGAPAQPSGGGKLPIMGYAVGNAPAVSTDETGAKLNEYFEGNARSLGMTNPVFEQRTLAFLNDNPYGVGIRSLDRSIAQQAQLYARYKQQGGAPVAPPGRSNHNHGLAADLSYEDPRATAWAHANAARYGLAFPVKSEDWHVEPMENRGMRFAGAQTGQGQASPIQVADASGQVPLPPVRPPELGGAVPLPPARPANMAAERLPIPPGQYLAQRQSAMDQAAREDASAPKAPPPVLGANGLPSPFVKPQQVAQAAPPQTGGTLSPGDRAALANPFVPQAMKEIILKKATRDPAEVEMKQLELQKARRDVNGPGYQLDIQGKQLANQKAQKELGAEQLQSIYDENGNEVKGYYRNGQFVTVGGAKAKDDPNSVQEYTYYVNQEKAQGREPKPYEQWQINKNRAGATVIDQRQESEFAKATGSAMAKRFNDLATEGDDAAQNATVIADLRRLGDKIGTGASAATTKRFADWGIKLPGAGDVEAYSALIDKLTPQQRVPGTGATSDFDAKMFKGSLPTLMNTPEGNKTILDTMERLNNNKMARGDVAMRVQAGELTPKQGLEEIRKLQAEARALSDQFKPADKPGQGETSKPADKKPDSPDGWIDMGNGVRVRKVR